MAFFDNTRTPANAGSAGGGPGGGQPLDDVGAGVAAGGGDGDGERGRRGARLLLSERAPAVARPVLEPEPRLLHACFEDAGMTGALRRLHARMCVDFASVMDQQQLLAASTLALPGWVQTLDFDAAVARCDARTNDRAIIDAMELVRAQRRASRRKKGVMALARGRTGIRPVDAA